MQVIPLHLNTLTTLLCLTTSARTRAVTKNLVNEGQGSNIMSTAARLAHMGRTGQYAHKSDKGNGAQETGTTTLPHRKAHAQQRKTQTVRALQDACRICSSKALKCAWGC